MEMVHHQAYSNFYGYNNNYGNFNHQNDKPFHSSNNLNDRLSFKSNKSSLDSKLHFSNFIKNNFNHHKHDTLSNQSQDLDRNNELLEFKPGMQDVPAWLKSLRLHKYKLIFSELSYEEMLELTEKQLEEKNVTKGARHKIIVNIDKLRARQSNLIGMEKSIEQEGISGLKQSLHELKNMLGTPIKAFEPENNNGSKGLNNSIAEGDMPSQIMSLLEKIFNYIQSENIRDDDVLNLYISSCDKCLGHEAFRASQKQRLISIKSKLEPLGFPFKNGFDKQNNKMKGWSNNMPINHAQNPFAKISNNSLNNSYYNGYNANGFNQYNSNNSLNNQNFNNHPFINNSKFNSSQQNIFSKPIQTKLANPFPVITNANPFSNPKLSTFNSNKFNEPLKFNVKAESFTSTKQLIQDLNKKNKINKNHLTNKLLNSDNYSNENRRKLSTGENRLMNNDQHNFDKFPEIFSEYNEKQLNLNQDSKKDENDSNRVMSPLSSCSLFNACSQIGHKINNQLNPFDKLSNLESNCLKNTNQFIFNNLFDNSTLMKCLENNTSLSNSNVFSHEKLESNYETNNFDDKLDENHQIYNHIELLSLRMTEQALGSSEFS